MKRRGYYKDGTLLVGITGYGVICNSIKTKNKRTTKKNKKIKEQQKQQKNNKK